MYEHRDIAYFPHNMLVDDFYEVPEEWLPMICFADGLYSMFGWRVRVHTGGCYGHVMWLNKPGRVATQGLFYEEKPIDDFVGRYRLKLVYCQAWTEEQRRNAQELIGMTLSRPKVRRLYDFLGIMGHVVKMPWLNVPWREYCSENVGRILGCVDERFGMKHPAPSDINRWCKQYQEYGVYGISDPGI